MRLTPCNATPFPANMREVALEEVLEDFERQAILKTLDQISNNKTTPANNTEVTYETFPSTQPSPG